MEISKDNTLTIRQSKTDQFGEGRVLFVGDETEQVIEELKAKANISRGALFRRVLKNGKTTTTRLTPEAVREIVKKRSQGIRGVKGRVSGHSLRVGSAVSLARGNASLVEMQVDGRWKDSRLPSHYASAIARRGECNRRTDASSTGVNTRRPGASSTESNTETDRNQFTGKSK